MNKDRIELIAALEVKGERLKKIKLELEATVAEHYDNQVAHFERTFGLTPKEASAAYLTTLFDNEHRRLAN